MHDSLAFLKCCESLAFLIRDVAHITPHNFSQCVQALRLFIEASFVGRGSSGKMAGGGGGEKGGVEGGPNKKDLEKQSEKSRSSVKRTPFGNRGPASAIRKARSAPHHHRYVLCKSGYISETKGVQLCWF
jgi:hypothetical protein